MVLTEDGGTFDTEHRARRKLRVWLYSIEDQAGELFVNSEANERRGVFSPDGTLMVVALEVDSGFGKPTELFQLALRPTENYDLFDVAPDGERFLVLELDGP